MNLRRVREIGERMWLLGMSLPSDVTPDTDFGRAFLDGWIGNTWKRRLFGTNFVRVLILPDRLLAVPHRSAA